MLKVYLVIVLLLSFIYAHLAFSISDEAWSLYRTSLKKLLSSSTSDKSVLTLLLDPTSKSEAQKRINFAQVLTPKSDAFEVSPTQTLCEKVKREVQSQNNQQLFIDFMKQQSKCQFHQVDVKSLSNLSKFTISGSSLVDNRGRVLHRKSSFISAQQNEVQLEALHPVRSFDICKEETTAKRPFSPFHALIGFNNPHGWNHFVTNFLSFVGPQSDQYKPDQPIPPKRMFGRNRKPQRLYKGITWQATLEGLQQVLKVGGRRGSRSYDHQDKEFKLMHCMIDQYAKTFIELKNSASLKEFELEFDLNRLDIIQVQNDAIESVRSTINISPLPREIVVSHQPKVRFSLSQSDFGSMKSAFQRGNTIEIAGMKFNQMSVIQQGEDDDDTRLNRNKWFKYNKYFGECAKKCMNKYDNSQEADQRREFNLGHCSCICAKAYIRERTIFFQFFDKKKREIWLENANRKCKTSSKKYVIEFSSTEEEALAISSLL